MQTWSLPGALCQTLGTSLGKKKNILYNHGNRISLNLNKSTRSASSTFTCLGISINDFASEIAHNKVLVAAGASVAIAQLSKPFTSALMYGNTFDFTAVTQTGGFPSSHSSVVVATATALGFQRGFSDPTFGLSVVYACLVMYDSQGVRREVGNHAKVLNRIPLKKQQLNSTAGRDRNNSNLTGSSSISSTFERLGSYLSGNTSKNSVLLRSKKGTFEEGSDTEATNSLTPLKESVGHSEVEVIAGALLGLFISLTVNLVL